MTKEQAVLLVCDAARCKAKDLSVWETALERPHHAELVDKYLKRLNAAINIVSEMR